MKIVLGLLLLLGLSGNQADEDHRRRLIIGRRLRPDRDVHVYGVPEVHNYEKPPDSIDKGPDSQGTKQNDDIEKPCPDYDVDCIRKFFANHSSCSTVYGSVPEPFFIKKIFMPMPHANITVTIHDVQVTGLNSGQITEFYINKSKGILVFGAVFKKIVAWCPKTVISYYRKNKEPIEVTDFSMIETINPSLTLTVPYGNDINLAEAYVYSYLPDAKPQLILGAALEDVTHTDLSEDNLIWKDNIGLTVRGAYTTYGSTYMTAFLENKICDFTRMDNKREKSDKT